MNGLGSQPAVKKITATKKLPLWIRIAYFIIFVLFTFYVSKWGSDFLDTGPININVAGDIVGGYGVMVVFISYFFTPLLVGWYLARNLRFDFKYGIATILPVIINWIYFILLAPRKFFWFVGMLDFLGNIPILGAILYPIVFLLFYWLAIPLVLSLAILWIVRLVVR